MKQMVMLNLYSSGILNWSQNGDLFGRGSSSFRVE